MRNNLFIIANSGWKYIGYALVAFILFSLLDWDLLAFISLLMTGLFIYLFRNPERIMPFYQQKNLVAPSDGVVTAIEHLENSDYAYRLDIESSYLNIGVLRVPMAAKVSEVKIVRGVRTGKNSKLFSLLNENGEITFADEADNKVKVLHRLKQSFAPLDIDLIKSQELMQAARYGVMINGVTSLYLPANFRLNLNVGQELRASETLVGYFS
ncbi:phosphatidylserine decarboxylase [Sulfurimonas paralvinellae]|uniref:Phosphatidylserine decarboxylase n=1 Tax=Sulfurimonas paralvinellae TaxID=317658 RepID=A0A7M1B991_9BACT|nr:phosphatidylserine decarboxylase [Sulfurimonas paralvinellae]QOP46274.1 phosphatidylserine decarboxylase [Sulfurimonas paralvinellae]